MAAELTDDELRKQLLAYGAKNMGPITTTTRSIYVKKLNHLKAAERRKSKSPARPQPSRKLIGFSSDESDGEDAVPGRGQAKGGVRRGRSTTRVTSSQIGTRGRAGLRRRKAEPEPTPVSLQSSIHVVDNTDGFASTDTDGEEDTSVQATPPQMVSKSLNTSDYLDDSSLFSRSPRTSNSRWGLPGVGDGNSSVGKGKSKVLGRPSIRSPATRSPRPQTPLESNSGHTHAGNNVANHVDLDDSYLSEEENIIQHGFKTKEDPNTYKCNQNVSKVLLVVAGLFFIGLAILYYAMRGTTDIIGEQTTIRQGHKFLLCAHSLTENCLNQEEVNTALKLIISLESVLSQRAKIESPAPVSSSRSDLLQLGPSDWEILPQKFQEYQSDYRCGWNSSPRMSKDELAMALQDQRISKADAAFKNALRIILINPDWTIRFYDETGAETEDITRVSSLEVTEPYISLYCRLITSASQVLFACGLVLTVGLSILLIVGFVRYQWQKKEEESRMVYELVEQIIDVLKSHYDSCQANHDLQPYMAIPHVRDMLIPPKQRKKMAGIWNKAVKFLSANESRVRVETQKISGEAYAVWRWIQSVPNGNKVWQGQAFGERGENSLNSPPFSPTPCLKIRNMFDPDIEYEDEWHVRIQDAILEKMGDKHGVVHISVDKASKEGCVYVKCLSSEAAGICFRALHGWWFDGKLVTVKYLRLERYHERFPDAVDYNTCPLTPSNNQKLSMAQPFHQSIFETS